MKRTVSGVPRVLLGAGVVLVLVAMALWWPQGDAGIGAQEERAVGSARERSAAGMGIAERTRARVVRELPHDPEAFTQGLLWWDGALWESTGQYGQSEVRKVDPETGEVLDRVRLPPEFFGEGLARVGRRLYQLTWKEGTALRWTLPGLEADGRVAYSGEGWGLCFDGEHLVWSDGTDRLRFVEPEDFSPVRDLHVTLDGKPLRYLNELECVGDRVWANVWTTEFLAEIDPASGRVTTFVDATGLISRQERRHTDVFNGIAHRPETGTFFLTGKLWPKMFEVRLEGREEHREEVEHGEAGEPEAPRER